MSVRVFKDDQHFGTYSVEQVQSLLQEGVLSAGDLALVDKGKSYIPVEKVAGLISVSPLTNELGSSATGPPSSES